MLPAQEAAERTGVLATFSRWRRITAYDDDSEACWRAKGRDECADKWGETSMTDVAKGGDELSNGDTSSHDEPFITHVHRLELHQTCHVVLDVVHLSKQSFKDVLLLRTCRNSRTHIKRASSAQ